VSLAPLYIGALQSRFHIEDADAQPRRFAARCKPARRARQNPGSPEGAFKAHSALAKQIEEIFQMNHCIWWSA